MRLLSVCPAKLLTLYCIVSIFTVILSSHLLSVHVSLLLGPGSENISSGTENRRSQDLAPERSSYLLNLPGTHHCSHGCRNEPVQLITEEKRKKEEQVAGRSGGRLK